MRLNGSGLLVLAVLGLVTACSGATPSTSPTGTSTSSTAATTAAGGDVDAFCTIVRDQNALLQGTEISALVLNGTPDAWKAYLDKTAAMNQQLVDAAPAEIRPSVQTLQSTAEQLASAMAAAGYDVKQLGSAKLIQLLQSPQRVQASTAVVTYVQAHCGLDLAHA
jgi:hypothetical protein